MFSAFKGKFYFGFLFGRRIIAAQAFTFTQITAGAAVQRETDRIQDRCFAGTGRSVDQKKVFIA